VVRLATFVGQGGQRGPNGMSEYNDHPVLADGKRLRIIEFLSFV
jgi:hypothetical protein